MLPAPPSPPGTTEDAAEQNQLLTESPELASLVAHAESVPADMALSDVQLKFKHSREDFFAIIESDRVTGLCSRANVGFMLGSRYGFSLYGSSPIMTARAPRPLIFYPNTPLRDVLDTALSRTGAEFFEDVVLVDKNGGLIGLVPVPGLARLQSQLFGAQLSRAARQDAELRQQNLDLFQINHQLRQSEGRYKVLFENNALGVAILNVRGDLLAHNRRLEQLLHFSENEAATSNLRHWLAATDQPAFASTLNKLERQAPNGEPIVAEFAFELPIGPRKFELHLSWVTETGQICAFLEDVTQERQLEKQLAQREKQNLLDTLAAGVAHELNNKLTPVLGFADLLQHLVPPELRRHTQCIQSSAEEAAAIIRQLLNLSKPSSAKREIFDVRNVVDEAATMLRYQLREARCVLDWAAPDKEVRAEGDFTQLKQILINLILNALHAMEKAPNRSVHLSLEPRDGSAFLQVRDTGVGISPENLRRIFDPFFTTKGPKGTGLGLSISASIARQHGGEISVTSVPGEGATFVLQLPLASTTEVFPLASPSISAGNRTLSVENPQRIKVLVVDDEEFVRQFMQEALRVCFGCQVDIAADGDEAITAIGASRYDLVLSDVRMPRRNGFELRAWIQQHQPELGQRFIFVTGHAGDMHLDLGLENISCPVIRKPFTIDSIRAICRPYLERAGTDLR
ncbi:ATP-binding protein [Oleiharenicola lentus]|uniref:ATP-binding protein n=1 Tax=Oleiharenicola lentus TaxID=2508720 RepID=UPI003F663D69